MSFLLNVRGVSLAHNVCSYANRAVAPAFVVRRLISVTSSYVRHLSALRIRRTSIPPSRHFTFTIIPHGIMKDHFDSSLGPIYQPTALLVRKVLPQSGVIMDKPSRSVRAKRIPEDTWESWREDLVRFFLEHDMLRSDIVEKMAKEHQFVVT